MSGRNCVVKYASALRIDGCSGTGIDAAASTSTFGISIGATGRTAIAFSSACRISIASLPAGGGEISTRGVVAQPAPHKASANVAHRASLITTSRAFYELILRLTVTD